MDNVQRYYKQAGGWQPPAVTILGVAGTISSIVGSTQGNKIKKELKADSKDGEKALQMSQNCHYANLVMNGLTAVTGAMMLFDNMKKPTVVEAPSNIGGFP